MKLNAIRVGSLLVICSFLSAAGCAVQTADAENGGDPGDDHVTAERVHETTDQADPLLHAPPPSEGELSQADDDARLTRFEQPFLHAPPPSSGELRETGEAAQDIEKPREPSAGQIFRKQPFFYAPAASATELRQADDGVAEIPGEARGE
jgi:hypothetical protein